ncbi:hypothetical protein YC2023_098713 [Brassica napus]
MINMDSRGHSYFIVRGEILGFMKDEQLRKHLPRMFSLIKNESWGLELTEGHHQEWSRRPNLTQHWETYQV